MYNLQPLKKNPDSSFCMVIFTNVLHIKAQGASIRTERKPFEPERFCEPGRTRIGLERSGYTEM